MLLRDAIDKFIQDKKVYCAPKTIENYAEHLIRFYQFAPDHLEELTSDVLRNYVIEMRDRKIRNITINTYMRSVKVFCRWLYEEGYLELNISKIKLPRPDPKIKQPLSQKEVDIILQEIPELRYKIVFRLMLDAGLRESEVCNLRHSDIDLVNNIIRIRNSKFNRNRIIPLSPRIKELLRQYNSGSEYIVLSRTRRQLSTSAIKSMFQKLKNRSGIQRIHAHLCRHTFATSYMMGGGNLEKLRVMLGHADYNVTKIYLQLAAEYEIVKYPIYKLDPVFFEKGY